MTLAYAVAALLLLAGTGLVALALWYAERLDKAPGARHPSATQPSAESSYRKAA